MTLTDSHQPKIAGKTVGASTKPAVFVDGASGTTGLGIQERLRLQNDVVVKNIAEEKRKDAGSPSLNRKLYEYARRKPLRGKILTENFYLDFLPELNRSQRYLSFPHPATPAFLEDLLADLEVNYILARVGAFPAPLQLWMSQHGFQEVFEEQGYDFFELPANRTGSGIRIFSTDMRAAFRGIVSGSLQGVGFREGDLVVINGKDTYPAMFISEHELSFQVSSTLLGGPFSLELVRPEGGERSRPYRIER